jgi:DNA-directed RNA polymerase subunit RPC12/RpoP
MEVVCGNCGRLNISIGWGKGSICQYCNGVLEKITFPGKPPERKPKLDPWFLKNISKIWNV